VLSKEQLWADAVNEAVIDLEPERKSGRARMSERANTSRFIGDLTGFGSRQIHPGATRKTAHIALASVIGMAASVSRDQLALCINAGETAQTMRDGAALGQVGKSICALQLGRAPGLIGEYYRALSLCRLGARAYPEAKKILLDVGDRATTLFRAKARVALGTTLTLEGDVAGGLSIHNEACRIAKGAGVAGLPVAFWVGMNRNYTRSVDGDHPGALAELERLLPVANFVGQQFPSLLHHYQNNLAIELAENGRLTVSAGPGRRGSGLVPLPIKAYQHAEIVRNRFCNPPPRPARTACITPRP
jgi:hypothetical protein